MFEVDGETKRDALSLCNKETNTFFSKAKARMDGFNCHGMSLCSFFLFFKPNELLTFVFQRHAVSGKL